MESFIMKALELQRLAHQLLFFEDDAPLYSDDFCRQNSAVLALSDTLYTLWSAADSLPPEEDAEVCLALLMGYNATIYGDATKQCHIQQTLDHCWKVLPHLSASLRKLRLLTYCYGEVYDEALAREARDILNSWQGRELTVEEREISTLLNNMQENPYPWKEIEE
ncbi:UpxZ family transcription anti-terminator antagonist [Bacteroides sp.]